MHWISLYDCVMLLLLLVHVFRPADSYVHPVMLLVGFIAKEIVTANPLVITRLLVLFVSIVQVYVILPLVGVWRRCCDMRRNTGAANIRDQVQITCMHECQDAHHLSTSGLLCPNCTMYRVQYEFRDKKYSMLLPPAAHPRDMIERYIEQMSHKETTNNNGPTRKWTWQPPIRARAIWWVCEGQRVLDLMPAALEIIGPDRDGHGRLSNGDSLKILPLNAMVWMSSTPQHLHTPPPSFLPTDTTLVYDLEVECHTGEVIAHRVTEALFTVKDLVALCTQPACGLTQKNNVC
jgi:hypothetical protein